MINVLQCFVVRCHCCTREAHIKAEGPPYFTEWNYAGDHGDSIVGWQIPTDRGELREIRCPDHRLKYT